MDYVDFCTFVLHKLIEATDTSSEYRAYGVPDWDIGTVVFGAAAEDRATYEASTRFLAALSAVSTLKSLSLMEAGNMKGDAFVTQQGRAAVRDMTPLWREICANEIDGEHAVLLRILNRLGSRRCTDHGFLECVDGYQILNDPEWMWDSEVLWATVKELERAGYAINYSPIGMMEFCPTYRSLVWETRCQFTFESGEIDQLLAEGETPTLDLKRQLEVRTASQKAEFIKDINALANTKASGQRFLLIGFTNDGDYYEPAESEARTERDRLLKRLTQEQLQTIAAHYTTPAIQLRYSQVAFRLGTVGRLEILRDPTELPYAVRESLGDRAAGQHRIEAGDIYLRDGTVTRKARQAEIAALHTDAERAKRRRDQLP